MPDGSTPLLLRQDSEAGITRLTLNRPDSRNSLSFAMLGALRHALVGDVGSRNRPMLQGGKAPANV